MDPHVIQRGPFRGELGSVIRTSGACPYYSYLIRADATGEVLVEGYAGEVQEAVQIIDLYLDYFLARQGPPEFAADRQAQRTRCAG